MREKKRVVFIVVLLEAILVAAAIFPLFGKDAVYELGPERMRVNFGTVMQDGWLAVDESAGQAGVMADFEQISLPAGGYRVKLRYQSDTDMKNLCTVTDEGGSFGLIQSDVGQVFAGLSETDFNIWLFRGTDDLGVHVSYGGVGAFKVLGLVIEETNALARMRLFTLLCLIALADAVWLWAYRGKRRGIPLENKDVCFGLFLIILLSSLPLFTDYLVPEGGDLGYHLMRIEGIKDGLLAGQFPVRIAPNWQFGFGYASSVFYGETLLYPAALLRLVGFPVQTSYQIYLFLVNVATALAAYGCFSRLFGQKQIGLLCSGLYTLSVYRIYRTYCFGALGETLAMLFLPLLVYGFYRVFAWDVSKEGYQRGGSL